MECVYTNRRYVLCGSNYALSGRWHTFNGWQGSSQCESSLLNCRWCRKKQEARKCDPPMRFRRLTVPMICNDFLMAERRCNISWHITKIYRFYFINPTSKIWESVLNRPSKRSGSLYKSISTNVVLIYVLLVNRATLVWVRSDKSSLVVNISYRTVQLRFIFRSFSCDSSLQKAPV